MKGFSITRGSNIFGIRSDILWLKDSVNTNLKIIWACNVNPLLRIWDIIITRHKIKTYFKLLQEIYWVLAP